VPFVAGYLLVWLAFSVAATWLQVELIAAGWIDDMGVASRPWVTAALLGAVGIYQLLPAKRACLDQCRSPVQFLVDAYRPGAGGALLIGLQHGLFCLGCCWALMGLLFVEKLLARGDWLRRAIGIVALAAGAAVPVFQVFEFG
jgi:predicted metal-binding membrane protein